MKKKIGTSVDTLTQLNRGRNNDSYEEGVTSYEARGPPRDRGQALLRIFAATSGTNQPKKHSTIAL